MSATESLKIMLKFFRESTLPKTQIFEWHKVFSGIHEIVEYLPYANRLTTTINDYKRGSLMEHLDILWLIFWV